MINRTSMRRRLVSGLVIAMVSVPAAAQAKFNLEPGAAPPDATGVPSPGRAVPRAGTSAEPGFHWADAGVGAAGTALLLGTGALAYAAPRRRRAQRAATG